MLNDIDLLQKFLLYFRDKAGLLIKEAKKSPIILPNLPTKPPKRSFALDEKAKHDFISKISQGKNSITKREYQCLTLFSQGLTSKEIGRELKIHPKTVDRHFENLKAKHSARNRVELLPLI